MTRTKPPSTKQFTPESLGAAIRAARENVGISQVALALKLGVAKQQVNFWEVGSRTPRALTLRLIAQVLGTTTDALLDLAEKKKST